MYRLLSRLFRRIFLTRLAGAHAATRTGTRKPGLQRTQCAPIE